MKRRKPLGRSIAGGLGAGLSGAYRPLSAAQIAAGKHSDLPAKLTPSAFSVPSSKYSPFTTPDYYTYTDDLTIERNRDKKRRQGKVPAAHSDDIPL
jgi:hypothetical protein